MKKGLIATIILLIVSIVICVFLGIESSQNYSKGYDDGAKDIAAYEQVIDKHIEKITSLESTISELQLSVDGYLEDIENLELNLNAANHDNDRLNNLVNDLREEAQGLNEQIELLNATIANLHAEIASLESQLSDKDDDNLELQETIQSLQDTISTLNTTIQYYEDVIASYNFDTKSIVKFEVMGEYYDAVVVEKTLGFSKEIADPSILGYSFGGWSIDGVTPIELDGYVFTNDITLTALMIEEEQQYVINSFVVSWYLNDRGNDVGIEYNFVSNIIINGNEIVDINILDHESKVLFNDILPGIDFTEFSTVNKDNITIKIPMSYVELHNPEKYVEGYENYFSAVYSYDEEGNFVLTEVDIVRLNYSYTDIRETNELKISNSNTLAGKEYNVIFREPDRPAQEGQILYSLTLEEISGTLYLSNDDQSFVLPLVQNDCGVYCVIGDTYGWLGNEIFPAWFVFYIDENNIPVLIKFYRTFDVGIGTVRIVEATENV